VKAEGDGPEPVGLTTTQSQRLRELGCDPLAVGATYADATARDDAFRKLEEDLSRAGRRHLQALRTDRRAPRLIELETSLSRALREIGFVQVVTPLIITAGSLDKMGLESGHPLRRQVFWLEDGRCLRPMLAPNLYTLLRRLGRIWSHPFGIFEIGPCFRRDSDGADHADEFTMLDIVELGRPTSECEARLEELAAVVMKAAGIGSYDAVRTDSEVYGSMVDIEVDGVELCSAAVGPNRLDGNWGIFEPWVGLGFGLERLVMARDGYGTIERAGRGVSYVDGVRLNI
jgi:pyrrolysyl-tRNA synthetase-like protein